MKILSLVSFSLLIVLSTACSKSVRVDGNGSNSTDLTGVTGQGTDPSPTPSSSVTASPTPSSSLTPSPSPSPTITVTPSPSPTITVTPSPSPTVTISPTPSPSPTHSTSPSPTPSPSASLPPEACNGGTVWVTNKCVCPGTDGWDGRNCISCADNQLWDPQSKTCENTCKQGMYATASGGCTSCPSGQAWDGTQCVSSGGSCGSDESCDSYKELKSPFVVPPRDCSHTCYYVKLSSAVALESSSASTVHDTNVTARNHNSGSLIPINPHIIGSSSKSAGATADIQFLMQGERQVMLSSDTAGSQDVTVNNFILIRLGIAGQTSYFGEGSADSATYNDPSVAGDNGYINVGGQKLTNYFSGGASAPVSFKPTDYSSLLKLNTSIDLKSEALDCGDVSQVSDIYLLFR